jgi:hypothetical protein
VVNRIVMALGMALVFAAPAAAANCDEDTLETVSDDGDILTMQSGRVYQVNSADTVDTQWWLSAEDVLICNGVMINKDESGEKASVTLLH